MILLGLVGDSVPKGEKEKKKGSYISVETKSFRTMDFYIFFYRRDVERMPREATKKRYQEKKKKKKKERRSY